MTITDAVEDSLGDVITDEHTPEQASEECWTLCIDAAHQQGLEGEEAQSVAKAACKHLGYPGDGEEKPKSKSGQGAWPPRPYVSKEV